MWELDYKESWVLKNRCFWTVVLKKTLESPLDCKEIQPVHPKGDQSWVFIGRTDAEAETPVLWPPHANSWLIWKDPDAGKDWRQEEKGTTEDGMVGWHHRLSGRGFGWTPGVGDGQACCGSWGRKESDTTERLNWTELNLFSKLWALCPTPYKLPALPLALCLHICDFLLQNPFLPHFTWLTPACLSGINLVISLVGGLHWPLPPNAIPSLNCFSYPNFSHPQLTWGLMLNSPSVHN